jgi:hypothetical protein
MAARRRALAIVIALPILLTGAYFAARETSTFSLRTIQVSGGTPVLQDRVRAVLAPLVGRSLMALNGGAVERRVDALPAVVSSHYDRAFPHTLRVTIVPEVPVAVLRKGKDTWLVSARGRAIRQIPKTTDRALPRIWVPTAAQVAAGTFLAPNDGGTVARVLSLAKDFPARFTTASLAHGELTLHLRLGLELRLGEPVDVRLKLAVARRALRVLPAGSTYLDVAVPQRPVAGSNPQLSTTGSPLAG